MKATALILLSHDLVRPHSVQYEGYPNFTTKYSQESYLLQIKVIIYQGSHNWDHIRTLVEAL